MDDFFGHLLEVLLRLVGISTADASERIQATALLAVCSVVTFAAGFFFSGIAAVLFFSVSALCGLFAILTGCGIVG